MLKLIVLDCDGVMFDSKESNIRYYNDMLALFNYPPMIPEDEVYCHMATVDGAIERIFAQYPQGLAEAKSAAAQQLVYADYMGYMTIAPDLVAFLRKARKKFLLAISTNRSTTMETLLARFELKRFFARVVTAADTRPKPAPDGLRKILKELDCAPEEALFLGDSITDRLQAQACGVPFVAFNNPQLDAAWYVSSFSELWSLPPLESS